MVEIQVSFLLALEVLTARAPTVSPTAISMFMYVCVKTALNTRNFSSGNDTTHALVEFQDEGSSAVVPLARLRSADATLLKEGQDVEVVWNAGKKYKAQVKMLGKL